MKKSKKNTDTKQKLSNNLKNISEATKKASVHYQDIWSNPSKINRSGDDLLLGWHLGFYEKGIKNMKEAMKNMNSYLNRILVSDKNNYSNILDAGCGIGATLLFNAEKNPDIFFYGIALGHSEIAWAKKIQKEKNIKNAKFMVKSFLSTDFPKNFFDAIYALESVSTSDRKEEFLREMKKILKPGGKLIIIDMFRQNESFDSFINGLHHEFFKKLEYPFQDTTIKTFNTYLKNEGFKEIKIKDIMKSGNVKYLELYVFLLVSIFQNCYKNILSLYYDDKNKSNKNPKLLKIKSIIKMTFEGILLFFTKTSYFSITAIKEK